VVLGTASETVICPNALNVAGTATVSSLNIGSATVPKGSISGIDKGYAIRADNFTNYVAFNFTFPTIPIVTATAVYGGVGYVLGVSVTSVTTTGFLYNVLATTGGGTPAHIEQYVGVNWIAIS
jgi:hypothetical protein